MPFNKEQKIYGLPVFKDNIIWLFVESKSVVVVDPGISKPVIEWIKKRNLELEYIFQTHHHLDHIGGSEELIKEWPKAKVIAPLKEKRRIPFQDISVRDGDEIKILNKSFQIIDLIGHTSSHIAFFSKDFNNPILFVGDTLFSAGCGRIFEGTHQEMYDSLKKISMLPKDTYIYCAHEYTKSNLQWALTINPNDKFLKKKLLEVEKILFEKRSTIPSILEEEMKINLFLRAENLQEFKYLRNNKDSWV